MNPNDLELYELFCQLLDRGGETKGRQRLELYYPPMFIEMAKEIRKLRKENELLREDASKYYMELEINMRLQDKLKLAKRELKYAGISLNI